MQLIGEILIYAVETGKNPAVNGNRLTDAAPHDVFPGHRQRRVGRDRRDERRGMGGAVPA